MWQHINLLRKLGEGGMGEVWLAYHADLGAQFAVKMLKPEHARAKDIHRFEREVRYLQALRHPNIVRIVDVSADPKKPGYAMEYCPDGSLEDHAPSYKGDTDKALGAFWEIAEGLDYLHSQVPPIIHRDLKPGNILVGADRKLKLSDFGLARSLDTERVTSSVWVSRGFSPPEQHEGLLEPDQRGDLFSLGATLYFLIVGQFYSSYTGVKGVDRYDVTHILGRLLRREPAERFDSVSAVKSAWEILQRRDMAIQDYLALSPEDRKAKISSISDVYCGMDDDLGLCSEAASFLEKILPVEPDAAVADHAKRALESIERQLRMIVAQMEQDNPSY